MRKICYLLLLYFLAALIIATCGSICLTQTQKLILNPQFKLKPLPPKTGVSGLDKPGPVKSPDPYFTIMIGENEVYRDATDRTLAYYKPILRLGSRQGTPLAEGVGELAASLDGFRFQYYKFESGGIPKWASMQTVIVAERPADVTLEAVQAKWRNITRLIPLPIKLDASTGAKMLLPYPPRKVTFSQLDAQGGDESLKWYYFSTNTHPTPPDLLTNEDNNVLNEAKARDFAAAVISDLSDMPSFQPMLEVRAVYPGWKGASPVAKGMIPLKLLTRPKIPLERIKSPEQPPSQPAKPPAVSQPAKPPVAAKPLFRAIQPARTETPPPPQSKITTPVPSAQLTRRAQIKMRPDLIRVIGELKPREDVDYTYSGQQEMVVRIPITYPKPKTPLYDYYFLSDSGRFGGPYFETSPNPNRPQRAEPPEGFSGYWYESHFLGKRLVWPAPKELRLSWDLESGMRPTCRFSVLPNNKGGLTAYLTYDLYPNFSTRQLQAAVEALEKRTGEKIDLLPFTDVLDANQMTFSSGNPVLRSMVEAKKVSMTKLSPQNIDDAWFRLSAEIPIDDWASFTLFMKIGELGLWEFGVITGASTGVAEKVSFQLTGDLLKTLGGPLIANYKNYNPQSGEYEVELFNFGLAPFSVRGLRFELGGPEQAKSDVWFEGREIQVPGIGSASSFDQRDGVGGSCSVAVKETAGTSLKSLLDSGKFESISVKFARDMLKPPDSAETTGIVEPDIQFSFLRSLCYQYIGNSELVQVPVSPLELSQWADYKSGLVVIRYQGYVYSKELDLSGQNKVEIRRLPREGAYAFSGKPGDADVLEYRAVFVKKDGTVVYIPAQAGGESKWNTADISGILLAGVKPDDKIF